MIPSAASSVQRLALVGAECTGKTSLGIELASAIPGVHVPEALRDFVQKTGRAPRQAEQQAIMEAQIAAEDEACAAAAARGLGWVIADPAALMTAIYSIAYFNDRSLLDSALDHQRRYALTVWCDTDIPWTADGDQRDGPAARIRVHSIIASLVSDAGLSALLVNGDLDRRLAEVTSRTRAL